MGVVRARHRRGGSGRTTKNFGARWLGARPAAGARRGHLGCSQGSASSSISAKGPNHGLGSPAPPLRTVRGAGARSRLPRRPYGLRHGRHAVAGPQPSPGLHRPARILPSPARVRPIRPLARVTCAPSTAAGQAPRAPPAAGASRRRTDVTEGAQGPCLQPTCPPGSPQPVPTAPPRPDASPLPPPPPCGQSAPPHGSEAALRVTLYL